MSTHCAWLQPGLPQPSGTPKTRGKREVLKSRTCTSTGLEGSAVMPGMRVQEVQGLSHLNELIWCHWVIENCGTSRPLKFTFHSIDHNRPQNPVRDHSLWLSKFMSLDLPCVTALLSPLDSVCLDMQYSGTRALYSLMLFKLNRFFSAEKHNLG